MSSWTPLNGLALLLVAIGSTGVVLGQPVPLDPVELQVNTYTTGMQYQHAVASRSDGSFVVAWSSKGSWGSDISGTSIQVRVLRPGQAPLGPPEFEVNRGTLSYQRLPRVAADAGGNFVVVWQSGSSFGSDDELWSIQARRFSRSLEPLDEFDFQVNTLTTSIQWRPDVAVQPGGDFVVVWESNRSIGNDTSGSSIQARRYRAGGTPLDPVEFQVNTFTWGAQFVPRVATRPDGGFVVVWNTYDTDGYGPAFRRYDAAGAPLDPEEVPVNVWTTGNQSGASVAVAADGSFVVAWDSYGSFGGDNDLASVQARRFDSGGLPLMPTEFQVNTLTTWWQYGPSVAADAAGNFVVAWSTLTPGQPGYGEWSADFRRYSRNGVPFDPAELHVHAIEEDEQSHPVAQVTPEGDPAFVWGSLASAGNDNDMGSIQARRFARPTIDVDVPPIPLEGCDLASAIAAATTGLPQGGCPAGSGGAIVRLPASSVFTFESPAAGATATPVIGAPVTILGRGSRIERDPGLACPVGPEFRLFEVAEGGLLTLENVSVSNGCLSSGAGGGVFSNGGTVVLRRASIEGNEAGSDGGGVAIVGGNLLAYDSSVRGNISGGAGGGLSVSGDAGWLLLDRVTVSVNSSVSGGGLSLLSTAPALARNATFSGNEATSGGGGIELSGPSPALTLDFSTVVGNVSPVGAGVLAGSGVLSLHGSLVGEGSGGADCASGAGGVVATGANFDTDGSCAALAGGNVTTVAALGLGPLADNGGWVRTHLPLTGSPALDAAPACATASGAALAVDARGYLRPTDDDGDLLPECELGAVERGPIFLDGFESGDFRRWSPSPP